MLMYPSQQSKVVTAIRKRAKFSKNPNELASLSTSKDTFTRSNVVENLNTAVSTLKEMRTDESPIVRLHLVLNPNTPLEVIEELKEDQEIEVRRQAIIAFKKRRK